MLSGNVGAGTWLVLANATARGNTNATGVNISAKLWSGAGAFFSTQASMYMTGAASSGFAALPMHGIITTSAASTPIALSCATPSVGVCILSAPTNNLSTIPSGTATYLNMVRLY